MNVKPEKFLFIQDWNYWWGVYHCADGWDTPDAAEFILADDEAGENPFFRLDFYNLPALDRIVQEGEFMEPVNPDYPIFLKQAEQLKAGEHDWFVGALYYPRFSPDLSFCNAPFESNVPLTKLASPPMAPYYAVIFLREEHPLPPEILTAWVERLSQPLFGSSFFCRLARVPTRQEALESYAEEFHCRD